MSPLQKLSPVMFFVFIISGVIAVLVAYVPNCEKKLYEETSKNTTIVGYSAGDYIPRVGSVEDIDECKVFTVEIKGENIKELGVYEKNRYYRSHYYTTGENHLHGEIDRIFDNYEDVSYSEYCCLTLPSGEKIIAYLDINLLDIKEDEYIVLPIGEKYFFSSSNLMTEVKERSKVSDENTKWYVDMSGDEWRQNVLGDTMGEKRSHTLVITFILSVIVITFLLYKYVEAKLGDELKEIEK